MSYTYEKKTKRFDKLTNEERLSVVFDLIHAFSLQKNAKEASIFLQDLLTANEIRNLSVRLRIAKLLLAGHTQREAADILHSSLATVNKVNVWLNQGGKGFTKTIKQLPLEYTPPKKLPPIPIEFNLPRLLATAVQYGIVSAQKRPVKQMLENAKSKEFIDKKMKEATNDQYRK